MGSVRKNELAHDVSADVRANIANVKTDIIVQRVTRTFLEFVELADTHDTTLHGGRRRANSDSSILYGDYGYVGHATPCSPTLAPATFFVESDPNDTASTSASAVVEKCWPTEYELAQASELKEFDGFFGLRTQAVVDDCSVSNELQNDNIPFQDSYGLSLSFQAAYCNNELYNDGIALQDTYRLPVSLHDAQQGSIAVQAEVVQGKVWARAEEFAREADEFAANLEMQAARLREQAWKLECQGSQNYGENLNCKSRSSMLKMSTSSLPVSEVNVDVRSLLESGDVSAPQRWQAKRVDKRQGHLLAAASKSSKRKTTLMLRHIPNKYTREALLSHFEEVGLQDCIDFIYVPMDFNRMVGLGYAFVNFASSKDAESARQMFDGFCSWRTTSHKVCEVSFSHPLQGLDAYIEHYRNSCLMHESVPDCCKPALFEAGIRQPFPTPTKQIPMPRMKR